MRFEGRIGIAAPANVVWEVFTDVERWAEWTESVTAITPLDDSGDGPVLALGRRFEIRQPKFPKLVWTVTAIVDGASFTWEQRSGGSHTIAIHEVEPLAADQTRVRQVIEQHGVVGRVVGTLTRGLTRKYLDLEAAGLKRRCEQIYSRATST